MHTYLYLKRVVCELGVLAQQFGTKNQKQIIGNIYKNILNYINFLYRIFYATLCQNPYLTHYLHTTQATY